MVAWILSDKVLCDMAWRHYVLAQETPNPSSFVGLAKEDCCERNRLGPEFDTMLGFRGAMGILNGTWFGIDDPTLAAFALESSMIFGDRDGEEGATG